MSSVTIWDSTATVAVEVDPHPAGTGATVTVDDISAETTASFDLDRTGVRKLRLRLQGIERAWQE